MKPESGIRIAPDQLSPEALRSVIEEFVTRDGTELTEGARKVEQVMELLGRGEAEIWFSEDTRTCNVVVAPPGEASRPSLPSQHDQDRSVDSR